MRNTEDPSDDNRPQQILVLPKALSVLESLVLDGPSTLTDITKSSEVEKAAVYRILNTFEARGYVAKDEVTRQYRPGPNFVGLARAVLDGVDLIQTARPYLVELLSQFGETVNLGTVVDGEVQYLDVLDSRKNLRIARQPGMRDRVHSTALGKAILSTFSESTAEEFLRSIDLEPKTDQTLVEIDVLLEDLARAKKRGYAIDDQENDLGAVCVGAPIVGLPNGAMAAISVSGPAARMTGSVVLRIGEEAANVAKQISSAVGGRGDSATDGVG